MDTQDERPGRGSEGASIADELMLGRVGVLCAEAPDMGSLEPRHHGTPAPDSDAAKDVATCDDATVDRVSWVSALSRLWISAASENLSGLAAIFNTPVLNHPPRPLLRAVLEHTARAWWVLDGASADARAWLARWEGLRSESDIATKDRGRTGTMASAPERLAGVEARIRELFGEDPKGRGPHPQHSLVGEEYGSFTRIVGDLARGTLGDDVPVEAIYSTHSLLMHPSFSAVLALPEKDGPLLKIPRWTPSWLVGSTLTVLVVWRGGLRRVLDHHGWTHPRLPEWSAALDEAVEEHNQRPRNAAARS